MRSLPGYFAPDNGLMWDIAPCLKMGWTGRAPAPNHSENERRAEKHEEQIPKGDTDVYLAIRQPNSTTAAPTAAAMTDVTIPPLSPSSPPM